MILIFVLSLFGCAILNEIGHYCYWKFSKGKTSFWVSSLGDRPFHDGLKWTMGPLVNIFAAFITLSLLFTLVGAPFKVPEIQNIIPGSSADLAGMKPRDLILAINGKEIKKVSEVVKMVHDSQGSKISFKILRDQEVLNVQVLPEGKKIKDFFGHEVQVYLIGV